MWRIQIIQNFVKNAGNLNYTEFCLKIRKIVYLKVNQKSAGHSNTHNVKKCGKLQIEKQTQKSAGNSSITEFCQKMRKLQHVN